ncbi:hypothetical protein BJD99_19625 [Rhodococcus sp. 1163]|uniref:hypothetical protein n=1 Tax=unclassified Rhodococcus (in: high G+C Gram-positive bacteria) TaxID=192944 RepID=UPI0009FC0F43|nr:hypothetical protein [Rhodococcus sp. 1163]ORI18930.1 hypothetical protein BJD99_19625 [Rhodococcus sp. 1163]
MMRMMWVGVLSILALTGCSSEAPNSSSEASAPATSATSSATAPASSAPAGPSTAAEAPPLATPPRSPEPLPEDVGADLPPVATPLGSPEPMPAPEANVALPPEGTDMPHGEALYLDICQRFLPAIDALESTGAASREQSVVGMRGKMESNPSWSTVSVEDQQEIVRGLSAAGNGSC